MSEQVNLTMSKLNVLQLNQSFMAQLGIYFSHLKEPTNQFYRSPRVYLILLALESGTIPSILDAFDNSSDFTRKLNAIWLIVGTTQSVGIFLNYGLNMTETKALHLNFQSIVDRSEFFSIFH